MTGGRRWWPVAAVAVLAHVAVLYWPVVTVAGPVSWSDKAVHVLVFAVPAYLVGRVSGRLLGTTLVFAIHAPVSELAQHYLLPGRSGDPWDFAADLVGVIVAGLALWLRARSRRW